MIYPRCFTGELCTKFFITANLLILNPHLIFVKYGASSHVLSLEFDFMGLTFSLWMVYAVFLFLTLLVVQMGFPDPKIPGKVMEHKYEYISCPLTCNMCCHAVNQKFFPSMIWLHSRCQREQYVF